VAHERTHKGQHEKREPAQRERAHDDPQRRRRLLINYISKNKIILSQNMSKVLFSFITLHLT
jgi:hypothetical protein